MTVLQERSYDIRPERWFSLSMDLYIPEGVEYPKDPLAFMQWLRTTDLTVGNLALREHTLDR